MNFPWCELQDKNLYFCVTYSKKEILSLYLISCCDNYPKLYMMLYVFSSTLKKVILIDPLACCQGSKKRKETLIWIKFPLKRIKIEAKINTPIREVAIISFKKCPRQDFYFRHTISPRFNRLTDFKIIRSCAKKYPVGRNILFNKKLSDLTM